MRMQSRRGPLLLAMAASLTLAAFLANNVERAAAGEEAAKEAPKVLIPLAKGFNLDEQYNTYYPLLAAGYKVDIAGITMDPILKSHKDEEPSDWDVMPTITLAEVDPKAYIALTIPGGHSPERLEEVPEAVAIAKAFYDAGKPISAVCHGPRLLGKAGVLQDRAIACWNEVRNEVPDRWKAGDMGVYVDQAVVVDGHLITSRYPYDMVPYMQRFLAMLADNGGLPTREAPGAILALDAKPDRKLKMATQYTLQALGHPVEEVRYYHWPKWVEEKKDLSSMGALLFLGGKDWPKKQEEFKTLVETYLKQSKGPILATEASKGVIAEAGLPVDRVVVLPDAPTEAAIAIGKATAEVQGAPKVQQPYDAAIVVRPGFDERVILPLKTYLESLGKKVTVLGDEAGWERGMGGLLTEIDGVWTDPPAMVESPILIAPGGMAPDGTEIGKKKSGVDDKRLLWLLEQHEKGATLLVAGTDSVDIARDPRFKGKKFATTAQMRWGFGKSGGKFTDEPALESTERVYSVSGPEGLPVLMRLLTPVLAGDEKAASE